MALMEALLMAEQLRMSTSWDANDAEVAELQDALVGAIATPGQSVSLVCSETPLLPPPAVPPEVGLPLDEDPNPALLDPPAPTVAPLLPLI
jgi:hypothetical protein